jgi:hypothetical protein
MTLRIHLQHVEVLHHEHHATSRHYHQEDFQEERRSGRMSRGGASSASSAMMEDDSFAYASERNRGRDHQLFSKLLNAQEFIRHEKEENDALRTILQLLR